MNRFDDIEETAAHWLVKLDASASRELLAQVDDWLLGDPRHRAAYLRLTIAWRRMDRLRTFQSPGGEIDADVLSPARKHSRAGRSSATQ